MHLLVKFVTIVVTCVLSVVLSRLEIGVAWLSFQGVINVHECHAFYWLLLMVFVCVIHVWIVLRCISFSYPAGPTLSHCESSSWSFNSTQVLKELILLLGDNHNLLMSLTDVSFLPYLCTKYFLRSSPSHNALVLPKDKTPNLVFPHSLKIIFQMNK